MLDLLLAVEHIDAMRVEEGEAPDFIVDVEGSSIGVEITEYVRGRSATGSPQRQQHRFIQDVLDEARRIVEARSAIPLWVTVDATLGRADVKPAVLAAQLAEVVLRCLGGEEIAPRPGPYGMPALVSPVFHECRVPAGLEAIVDRLTIVELPARSVTRWRIRQSGNTLAYIDELEEIVASKESLIRTYLDRTDEVWLAIDAFGGDILQAITLTTAVVEHPYRTTFARLYVVDRAERQVVALRTAPPHDPISQDNP